MIRTFSFLLSFTQFSSVEQSRVSFIIQADKNSMLTFSIVGPGRGRSKMWLYLAVAMGGKAVASRSDRCSSMQNKISTLSLVLNNYNYLHLRLIRLL